MTLRLPPAERAVSATTLRSTCLRSLSIACAALGLLASPAAFGATFYVDRSNVACNDTGPGTEAIPYCTINAAQAAHFGAGVTIAVKPGTYDEVVNITKSGAAGSPFVFQALGPGVVVNGRISMSARQWITIDGFTVNAMAGQTGIMVGSSPNTVITRNTVLNATGPSSYGIYVSYASNQYIAGNTVANCQSHGFVIRNVTGSILQDNASHHNDHGFNFKVDGGPTSGNVIRRNRAWSNATTGFYYLTVQDNVSIQNLAWSNGDHGIQHINSRGHRHIGDVVWGNGSDGVSVKDNSTGNSFVNCILENNAVSETAYEIEVDSSSTAGWVSDDNVIWNANAMVIKFGGIVYHTAQTFSTATGNDTRTRTQFPRFVDPANGDFRLLPGSPAIDCANSSVADWPAADFEGHARFDDPGTTNGGTGPVDHADRGAFEFAPNPSADAAELHPSGVELGAMAPNPVTSRGEFTFFVPTTSRVRASVVDVQGRLVATLVDRVCAAGRHVASWDGGTGRGRARPGLYFVRLETPGVRLGRRFLVTR